MSNSCPRCHAITATVPCEHCGARFDPVAEATRVVIDDVPPVDDQPSAPDLLPGTVTQAGYRIDGVLSTGGMGVVLRASHPERQQAVVLKAPRQRHSNARLRFTREAKALASCDHPHVVPLIDIDCTPAGTPLLVLPHLGGSTLRAVLEQQQPNLPLIERVITDLARAVDHCHRRGVVHRDIKPDNIMLNRQGCTLIDFGLALVDVGRAPTNAVRGHLTPEGSLLGTPPYAAPEQLGDPSRVSPAADVYSLGMVLNECLAACSREETERRQVWRDLAEQCCDIDPGMRPPPSAVLATFANFQPRLPANQPETPQLPTQHRWWFPTAVAGGVVGAVAATWLLLQPVTEDQILSGAIDDQASQQVVLRAEPGEILQVEALGNTNLRLPGGDRWTPGSLRIPGTTRGYVTVQVSDPDGTWQLRVRIR